MSCLRKIVGALLWLPAFTACASILDIQTAKHDPALDVADSGTTLCERYCDEVQKNCTTSQFEQYTSRTVCLSVCSRLQPGSTDDVGGNTVGCRLHYAKSAGTAGEKNLNCPAAGPGGNGICGSNCESLCAIVLPTCQSLDAPPFANEADCLAACAPVPDTNNYSDSNTDTYTVQCRLYHVSAAQTDPVIHCKHVAGIGFCAAPPDAGSG